MIGGTDMTQVEPYHRNVAMAFESYALYPQKTVFENLASPLRSGRTGRYTAAAAEQRIEAVTTTLGIDPLLRRFPRELSNGQRQRVGPGPGPGAPGRRLPARRTAVPPRRQTAAPPCARS